MRRALTVLAVGLCFLGCKPKREGAAEVKTLDKLVGDKPSDKLNHCGLDELDLHADALRELYGTVEALAAENDAEPTRMIGQGPNIFVEDEDRKVRDHFLDEVVSTLANVPPDALYAYFDPRAGFIGQIRVSTKTDEKCSEAYKKLGKSVKKLLAKENADPTKDDSIKIRSCVDSSSEPMVIWLNKDEKDIRHALVREFGIALIDGVHRLDKKKIGNAWEAPLEKDLRAMSVGLLTVLQGGEDSDDKDRKDASKKFKDATGVDLGTTIKEELGNLEKADREDLETLTFAETFDSFYCNSETAQTVMPGKDGQPGGKYEQIGAGLLAFNTKSQQVQLALSKTFDKDDPQGKLLASLFTVPPLGKPDDGGKAGLNLSGRGVFVNSQAGNQFGTPTGFSCPQGYTFSGGWCYQNTGCPFGYMLATDGYCYPQSAFAQQFQVNQTQYNQFQTQAQQLGNGGAPPGWTCPQGYVYQGGWCYQAGVGMAGFDNNYMRYQNNLLNNYNNFNFNNLGQYNGQMNYGFNNQMNCNPQMQNCNRFNNQANCNPQFQNCNGFNNQMNCNPQMQNCNGMQQYYNGQMAYNGQMNFNNLNYSNFNVQPMYTQRRPGFFPEIGRMFVGAGRLLFNNQAYQRCGGMSFCR
jgi:hypothetical protein